MDINLIGFFGVALKENKELPQNRLRELQTLAAKTGYIVHPDCWNSSVLKWLMVQNINHNSTFYKTWEDVTSRDRLQLYLEQIVSYAINYGMGGNFDMNDHDYSAVPDIRKYKLILPITEEGLFIKCRDMIYTNVALKQITLDSLVDYVVKYHKEFPSLLDVDSIQNKEALARICAKLNVTPKDKFNLLRYMVYQSASSSMLIKNAELFQSIEFSKKPFNMNSLNEDQLKGLASIFYRFKPIFLAFKKQKNVDNAHVVNKIRKMAKKYHNPMRVGLWEDIINNPMPLKSLVENLKLNPPTNFKLISLIQAIRENRQVFGATNRHKLYIVRNGKMFLKDMGVPDVISTKYDWWDELEAALYRELVNRLSLKSCSVKLPKDLKLACPTSEKNFIGNIPFGSYYDMKENNMIGIYWRNEWGAKDLDLSFVDFQGRKIGWNSGFCSSDRGIIYSGDMTSANPEASEVIYFSKACPDGLIHVNRFSGDAGAKYMFSVAQSEVDSLPTGYMMDPNTIKFQTEVISKECMDQCLGMVKDKRLYICEFNFNNSRVSGGDHTQHYIDVMDRKSKSFVDLETLLKDAGFTFRKRSTKDNPIDLDLSELNKDTLIKLFAE